MRVCCITECVCALRPSMPYTRLFDGRSSRFVGELARSGGNASAWPTDASAWPTPTLRWDLEGDRRGGHGVHHGHGLQHGYGLQDASEVLPQQDPCSVLPPQQAEMAISLTAVAELVCEREASSLSRFAGHPQGFARLLASSTASSSTASSSTAPAILWHATSRTDVCAFAQVCMERLDDARCSVRIEALRGLLVAALALPGSACVSPQGDGEEISGQAEAVRRDKDIANSARANTVLEHVSSGACISVLVQRLCCTTRYGSHSGEGLTGERPHDDEDAHDASSPPPSPHDFDDEALDDEVLQLDDLDKQRGYSALALDGWDESHGLCHDERHGLCHDADERGGARGNARGNRLSEMRVESSCVCNLLFVALLYRQHMSTSAAACASHTAGKAGAQPGGEAHIATPSGKGGSAVGGEDDRGHTDSEKGWEQIMLLAPCRLGGGREAPCLLVVLVQLLYRAGSVPAAQGVKAKGAGSLAYRYPVSLRVLPLLAV